MSTELPTNTLAQRLAAYIPATLTRQILAAGLPTPGLPHALTAATMFTDMSGFTAMSEELASDGPRGAEEVNRVLLLTFTGMIDLIHSFCGAISHFYGDAMSVYFPDEDGTATSRALVCAQQMQQLMRVSFNRVGTNRPPGKEPFFKLTMKVGLGYGDCQELIVGTPESLEFVLTGTAVDEAAEAEKQAEAGQVIASRTILQQAGLPLVMDDAFCVMDNTAVPTLPATPILNWSDYNEADLQQFVETITPFIPPALYERLTMIDASEISLGMAEHRPVTSLFVQFEYAGDEDESSAIATAVMGQQLQAYYVWACEVVARFGQLNARVNRVLTGDKGNQLHIMFGAPVAPDAPDQAIRCALALQRERPSYIRAQRIGLAAGKVFAGPVGSADRREYTVVGDVVNLSARLMQACAENVVYTDHVTADRSGSAIEFETLEPIKMKGKQESVIPYRPLRDQTTSHLHAYFGRWERPLVGRDMEQKLLHDGLEMAVRGQGGVFALYGATGAGKSHLLSTGVKQWLDGGGTVLVGVCQPQLADVPFGPWRVIWQDFFDLQPAMSLSERIAAMQQRTAELVPDSADEVGLWADVTGLPIPQSERLQQLTAEARQARLYALMRRCLQAAAAQRQLFLIIEDVHWSDQSTLDWIDELTSSMADYHVYLALTFRDQTEVDLATMARPLCTIVKLGDLSPDDARKIVAQTVGATDLPASVEQHLGIRDRDGRESKVSPLFLDEALKMMVVGGVFEVVDGNRVRVNEGLVARMQVPDTIHGLLLARLDRLSPGSRDLLQVASVIGRQFSVEPLDTITPLVTRPTIAQSMDELTTEQLMQLVTADPDETYLFQQALTHEVAYESLPFARRQVLHADVAAWLQGRYEDNLRPLYPVLAFHYTNASVPEKALYYALEAGHDARAIFANKEAVDLYNLAERHLRVLDEEVYWETAVDICLSRAEALMLLGDFGTATKNLEQGIETAQAHDDWPRTARAYNRLAEIKYRQAHFAETRTLTQKVIARWGSNTQADELARAYQWQGMAANAQMEHFLALFSLQKAEEICVQTENNERLARVLEGMAHVYYLQGNLSAALAAMQRSVDLSRHFSTAANVAVALNNIALIQSMLGLPEGALQSFNEAVDLVRDVSRNFLAHFLTNRAAVQAYLGQFPQAQQDFQEAINHFVVMDDAYGLVEAYSLWGFEYSNALQLWDEAKAQFEQAQAVILKRPQDYPEQQVRVLLGLCQMALHEGELTEVAGWLETAVATIGEKGLSWWQPIAAHYRGQYLLALKQNDAAREQFEQGLSAIAGGGSPDYRPLLLLALAQLTDDAEERADYLQQCVATAQQRTRFADRVYCLKMAESLLSKNK